MLMLSDLIVRDPSKIDLDLFYAQTLGQTVTFSLKSYCSVYNQGIWESQVLTIFAWSYTQMCVYTVPLASFKKKKKNLVDGKYRQGGESERSVNFAIQHVDIRIDAPAAKAWQVSRHTPTLVWSLTWSMMLLSSERRPPTVLPWPLMFSNTDRIEGRQRTVRHQF